ncbi:MAG TPA: hypothetical protein VGK94_07800 [Candidatus Polarisedimenticolia bacterium]|jgi:hypothetical protein
MLTRTLGITGPLVGLLISLAMSAILTTGPDCTRLSCSQQFRACVVSGVDRDVCKAQMDVCKVERRASQR